MKDDDELEMLLGEIPHATSSSSSSNNNATNHHHQHHHVYGSAAVTQRMNGNGHVHVHAHAHAHAPGTAVHDDESLKHKYAFASSSSPVSGFSWTSDGSSSSLFSGGGGPSHSDIEELRRHLLSVDETRLVDCLNLSRSFSRMYIRDDQREGVTVPPPPPYGVQYYDQSAATQSLENVGRNGVSYRVSVPNNPVSFEGEGSGGCALVEMPYDQRVGALPGPGSDRLFCWSDFSNSAHLYRNNGSHPMGFVLPNPPISIDNPPLPNPVFYHSQARMNLIEASDSFYSPNGRDKVPMRGRVPRMGVGPLDREDSLGEGVNSRMIRHKNQEKKSQINGHVHSATVPKIHSPFTRPSKFATLAEAQGYIYHIAKDQQGCRFLQKMFDEGTSLDVQIIFSEIIGHAVELMMNPFGNYLMQKLLEVCNEEQRMHLLLTVTEEPRELVRISLNTHGTRVVQKLIDTLKTKQQISLVISALEPGFLALIKDLNGNHVIQRCLQCFPSEDSKFIFVAAAKYCVDIATHQHGCCVLQRCIGHATGEHRENLIAEISANGILLAEDAYGNYVVQYILELKIPYVTAKLTSQFERNYVHLSKQKFSSHVVEKCLLVCNEETRAKIIHELLSSSCFDQLLQDPHANYVIQKALSVSEGHLRNALVDAIESYKAISRNSPYSKKIFSQKFLKR